MRQRTDFWRDQGAADALVRLMTTGYLRPAVSFAEVCKAVGVPRYAAVDAVSRYKARTRSSRPRQLAPGPAPTGTKWCGYGGHFPRFEDFAPNRSSTTGYQSWCRGCNVLARREQRQRGAA